MRQAILVVDDEFSMREALAETLKRTGYSISTAIDGLDAINKFETERYDLVITDVKMPNISGLGVLREIKKMSPVIPVIMLTAYGTVGDAVMSIKEGAFDYLLKPFSSDDLNKAVKRALKNSRRLNEPAYEEKTSRNKEIITNDPKMLEVIELARTIAPSSASVLIEGDSGTGKELLAHFIHKNSSRRDNPFIAINCASLPEGLLESELFGHEKGSFTGAISRKLGKFELANGGTMLLDEISEMDIRLQAKLLRVLQEREIDRVGGKRTIPLDVRIISTTNKNLKDAVEEGKFRRDLFYRLNVVPLKIPSLRERKSDIPLLGNYFLKKFSLGNGAKMPEIPGETILHLQRCEWQGNVRELENVIERAYLFCKDDILLPRYLFLSDGTTEEPGLNHPPQVETGTTVKNMEKQLIFQTLKEVGDNRTRAAKILGISIRTLRNKLSDYQKSGEEGNYL